MFTKSVINSITSVTTKFHGTETGLEILTGTYNCIKFKCSFQKYLVYSLKLHVKGN